MMNAKQRNVVLVGYDGVLGLELFGALDVLNTANHLLAEQERPPAYHIQVLSLDGKPVRVSGLDILTAGPVTDYAEQIDTLLVPGGGGVLASQDRRLVEAVRNLALRARRVVSFCTGTFILAAAGLLDGRRVTTHWRFGQHLAERFPALEVDTDPIYIQDGALATSAGVTAGIDLMLALVEDDLGPDIARSVAGTLVVFLRRTGNQAQFSVQLAAQPARRTPLRELQQFMAEHPNADLSMDALAERVHMSPRHFSRVFASEVGLPPGRYVEQLRVETARRYLEEGDLSMEQIATASGLGSSETLRRVFVQTLGISPAEYRRRFRCCDAPLDFQ